MIDVCGQLHLLLRSIVLQAIWYQEFIRHWYDHHRSECRLYPFVVVRR